MRGTVYMIRNLVTHKVYIGATIQDPSIRFGNHLTCMKNPSSVFHEDFMKYGRASFKLVWWDVCDDMERVEKSMIRHFQSSGKAYNGNNSLYVKRTAVKKPHRDRTPAENIHVMVDAERMRLNPVTSMPGGPFQSFLRYFRGQWLWANEGPANIEDIRHLLPAGAPGL